MAIDSNPGGNAASPHFCTTHWSVVLRAGAGEESGERQKAMEELCRAYWYPLYAFIRRRGYPVHDAQDLVQSFFETILEQGALAVADPGRGRFRSFILAALGNFLANEARNARRQKRGGGVEHVSIDLSLAEERFSLEPATNDTPEHAFERQWLEVLMKRVLDRLERDFAGDGLAERFAQLQVYLVADRGEVPFKEMAEQLGMTEAALKGVVRRLRARYRELFREEVLQTVGSREEVEEEIRHLMLACA